MAASEKGPSTKTPVSLRIKLKYADVDTFVEKFGANVTRAGIFLASRAPRPVGTTIRFELLIADGKSKVLKGDGVVIWIKDYDPAHPQRAHGMGLKFSRLDAESHKLVERILARKKEKGAKDEAGVPAPNLVTADSSPVSVRPASEPGISAPIEAAELAVPDALPPSPPTPAVHEPMNLPTEVKVDPSHDELLVALASAHGLSLDTALEKARAIAKRTVALGVSELPELAGLLGQRSPAANDVEAKGAGAARETPATAANLVPADPAPAKDAVPVAPPPIEVTLEAGEPDEYDVHVARDEEETAPLDMSALMAGDDQGLAPPAAPYAQNDITAVEGLSLATEEGSEPVDTGTTSTTSLDGSPDASLDADIDAALDLVIDDSEVPVDTHSGLSTEQGGDEASLSDEEAKNKKGFFKKLFRK